MDSLRHMCFTTTNPSYTFPTVETCATAMSGTAVIDTLRIEFWFIQCYDVMRPLFHLCIFPKHLAPQWSVGDRRGRGLLWTSRHRGTGSRPGICSSQGSSGNWTVFVGKRPWKKNISMVVIFQFDVVESPEGIIPLLIPTADDMRYLDLYYGTAMQLAAVLYISQIRMDDVTSKTRSW